MATDLRPWLSAIGTLTSAVNAGRDLNSLLDLVAATARDLLDLSFCAVMVPDPTETKLLIAGSSGLPSEYIARVNQDGPVRLETNASHGAPASRAFRSGAPYAVADVAAEGASSWTDVAREQGYRSILAVPLRTNSGVIGTLNSYRLAPHKSLAQDIEQLGLLAEHAAIAITSARIVDDLRDQHRFIVRSEEIHDRLLGIAVRSGGVAGIATALHELLGSEVVICDAHGTTMAAHPPSSTAVAPADNPLPSTAAADRPGTRELVHAEGPHVAVDVLLNKARVATVWLLDRADELDPLGIRAAEHASVVLSLELLRQRTAAEVEQTLRGELLADLLDGADPTSASIRERAALMDHDLRLPHRMLVAKANQPPSRDAKGSAVSNDVASAQRAASEAVRMTSHLRPRPLIAAARGFIVALWPTDGSAADGERLIRRAVASTQEGAAAALAVTDPAAHGIAGAYRIARGVLAFASADGRPQTAATLDDLGAAGLLLQFAEPDELRRYAERTIGILHRYDSEHGADLVRTLRTYLDLDLDRRATGEQLVIHPNTVSQRLRRVESLTGLDLRSPRSVIDARAALMLSDVADAINGAAD